MQAQIPSSAQLQDAPSKILNILSFVCPPLGLVVYLSLVGKLPRQALSAGLSAAKGIATWVAFLLLFALGIWLVVDILPMFSPPQSATEPTVVSNPPTFPPGTQH